MKKIIFLLLFIIPLSCYSQLNDTIFYKNGNIEPVYSIDGIKNNLIYYTPKPQSAPTNVSVVTVERIASKYNDINDKFQISQSSTKQSQSNTGTSNNNDNIYLKNNNLISERKITPVQYNLYKFYNQKRAGHICMGAGIISGVVFGLNPIENTVFGYIAGGLSLASFIIDIDSYKWIKRASLETNINSITLKVKL
mgnify:CR=1 FL=1